MKRLKVFYDAAFELQSIVDGIGDAAVRVAGKGGPLGMQALRLREKRAQGDFWTASAIAQELAGELSGAESVSVPPEVDMSLGELLAAAKRLPELLAEIDRLAHSLAPDDVEAMGDDDALVELPL